MYIRGCVRSRGHFGRPGFSRNQDLVSDEDSTVTTGVTSPTPLTISSVTTQLDSLSMATDDNDTSRPTVSKFPRTRPAELNSKQGESGQKISLVANYIKILAASKWDLYRYHCLFESDIELRKIRRETLAKIDALDKYYQINGILPTKIIIYRDGVNDTQLLGVNENELSTLNELCMKIQDGYMNMFSFLQVFQILLFFFENL